MILPTHTNAYHPTRVVARGLPEPDLPSPWEVAWVPPEVWVRPAEVPWAREPPDSPELLQDREAVDTETIQLLVVLLLLLSWILQKDWVAVDTATWGRRPDGFLHQPRPAEAAPREEEPV